MSYEPCGHKSVDDFSVVVDDIRIWECSVCGKIGKWDENWCYYGSIECRKCWSPEIEYVYCSDECFKTKNGLKMK